MNKTDFNMDGIEDSSNTISPSVDDIVACQFSNWYETFRTLPKDRFPRKTVTIKSIVIPLPQAFLDYLKTDGVTLPIEATNVSSLTAEGDDNSEWSDEDNDNEDAKEFSFPTLTEEIRAGIETLGGEVMPKLNWSSPKDAVWMNNGKLKCQTPGDVYVLLKSSDFIMHDLLHVFDNSIGEKLDVSYELVLRQWCNLYPSMEFRCFVWGKELIAISQRKHTEQFPHLVTEKMIIRSEIIDFFDEFIQKNSQGMKNYTFDIYIDRKERPWLLDFNVWGTQTDGLLFTWEELSEMVREPAELHVPSNTLLTNENPQIRVVETENEVRHDPLASYRAPIDTVDLASMTASDASKFEDFMKLCSKPSQEND
eukprot:CAMPEP_0194217800 /NCGR_PEP_ID=MMETSP0156-20130528/22274_1 /TAXON_ID=33649 /ORGANISM="Thalassionema nitzschioides, Strain L26-B" /LENGTH=365 /DNA_ID=CAMNT_0038946937 /DNA_START=79 /DNA_END=1176 /DNA_ORIENTATION=-